MLHLRPSSTQFIHPHQGYGDVGVTNGQRWPGHDVVRLAFTPRRSFLDTSTGAISGTPTALDPSTAYTVTASNTGESTTATVTITVNDIAPSSITYAQFPDADEEFSHDRRYTNLKRRRRRFVVGFTSPPNRFVVDQSTGAITGTPTVTSTSTTYTVTATNTGGSATATVTILVNDEAPYSIAYNPSSSILTKDVAMTTITPTASGGAVNSWSITPALPTGLLFDTSTGAISGTPTVISSSTTYTVTATNAGGSGTATLDITVNDLAPSSITYTPNSLTLTKDSTMATVTPTVSGGAVVAWTISPHVAHRPFLLSANRCHQRNTFGPFQFHFVHRDGHQHRWQCNGHRHHSGEHCSPVFDHLHAELPYLS